VVEFKSIYGWGSAHPTRLKNRRRECLEPMIEALRDTVFFFLSIIGAYVFMVILVDSFYYAKRNFAEICATILNFVDEHLDGYLSFYKDGDKDTLITFARRSDDDGNLELFYAFPKRESMAEKYLDAVNDALIDAGFNPKKPDGDNYNMIDTYLVVGDIKDAGAVLKIFEVLRPVFGMDEECKYRVMLDANLDMEKFEKKYLNK